MSMPAVCRYSIPTERISFRNPREVFSANYDIDVPGQPAGVGITRFDV
jgi:hypothetical protein